MKVNVELTDDTMDEIVRISLKEAYKLNAKSDRIDCSDDEIPVDEEFLNSVDLVLQYFCNQKQYQEWINEKMEFMYENPTSQ